MRRCQNEGQRLDVSSLLQVCLSVSAKSSVANERFRLPASQCFDFRPCAASETRGIQITRICFQHYLATHPGRRQPFLGDENAVDVRLQLRLLGNLVSRACLGSGAPSPEPLHFSQNREKQPVCQDSVKLCQGCSRKQGVRELPDLCTNLARNKYSQRNTAKMFTRSCTRKGATSRLCCTHRPAPVLLSCSQQAKALE